jgi:hypothetical protein
MARLTSGLFVQAYVRRATVAGAFAAVLRKGAQEGGSIFVTVESAVGTALYGPAPQSAYAERPDERLFVLMIPATPNSAQTVAERLERETRFDPDLWIVGLDDRDGRHFLDLARPDPA